MSPSRSAHVGAGDEQLSVARSGLSATYSDVHAQLADVTSKLQALATSPAATPTADLSYLSPAKSQGLRSLQEAQGGDDEGAPRACDRTRSWHGLVPTCSCRAHSLPAPALAAQARQGRAAAVHGAG
jgi:hypothetical protein